MVPNSRQVNANSAFIMAIIRNSMKYSAMGIENDQSLLGCLCYGQKFKNCNSDINMKFLAGVKHE